MADEQSFNGYIFEPQADGALQIRLSDAAGGSEVTVLPADLVAGLRAYLAAAPAPMSQPGVEIEPAEDQPINPRDRLRGR
jgi:hypothetical protein